MLNQFANQTEEMKMLQQQLDEAKGEMLVMKKRHETSIRVSIPLHLCNLMPVILMTFDFVNFTLPYVILLFLLRN